MVGRAGNGWNEEVTTEVHGKRSITMSCQQESYPTKNHHNVNDKAIPCVHEMLAKGRRVRFGGSQEGTENHGAWAVLRGDSSKPRIISWDHW